MKRACALLFLLTAASTAWAEDKKPAGIPAEMQEMMAKMMQPGLEHKKLDPLAGSWDYTCKMWMDPAAAPMESKGKIERKWIFGNRYLEEKIEGTSFFGPEKFESLGTFGYDNGEKQYQTTWLCNMCTSTATSKGSYDASNKTFTFDKEFFCPMRQTLISSRDKIRIESNDKHVMESFEVDGGKEKKVMEMVATRQK